MLIGDTQFIREDEIIYAEFYPGSDIVSAAATLQVKFRDGQAAALGAQFARNVWEKLTADAQNSN